MVKSRRIYLASSWRNARQPAAVNILRGAGHQVYDFRNPRPGDNGFQWSSVDPDWQSWDNSAYREALDTPIARLGFANDWQAMLWADTCVLLLPCGRSAHLEAGYFVGAGKELYILLSDTEQQPELMYLMATRMCVEGVELLEALNASVALT